MKYVYTSRTSVGNTYRCLEIQMWSPPFISVRALMFQDPTSSCWVIPTISNTEIASWIKINDPSPFDETHPKLCHVFANISFYLTAAKLPIYSALNFFFFQFLLSSCWWNMHTTTQTFLLYIMDCNYAWIHEREMLWKFSCGLQWT